jgi:outer membrane protein TolC
MQYSIKRTLGVVSFVIGVFPTVVSAQTYSFEQCVETTLNQNPSLDVSQYKLQQAQSALSEASNSRLPQVTLSAMATHSNNALNVFGMKLNQRQATFRDFGFIDQGLGIDHAPDDLNKPDAHNDFSTKLEVLLPVWNGGKITSFQDQAKAMIQAAQHGDEAVKQYLIFNVYQSYEAVHTAKAYVHVAQQAVKASTSYVETTENLVKQGIVVKSDLLSAKVNLSQAQTSLQLAETNLLVAKDNLRSLMFVDDNQPLQVGVRKDLKLPAKSLEELTNLATLDNPAVKATREVALSSKKAVAAVDADNYPSFNLMARAETSDDSLGFESNSYTVAGIVSWKLTDFGVTSSRVDRANALANEKQSELIVKESKTRLDVLTAWRILDVAKKRFASNKLAVKQAEEAQRLILKRHKGGVATMTEVLASQTQLDKTRADLVKSQFDINVQKAKIKLAIGSMSLKHI